jgi:hypothetical protein
LEYEIQANNPLIFEVSRRMKIEFVVGWVKTTCILQSVTEFLDADTSSDFRTDAD